MYLGIDLGGTKIAAGLVDDDARIVLQQSVPTRRSRTQQEIFGDIISLGRRLLQEGHGDVAGVGIGVPGPVDRQSGVVINCVNLGWKAVPVEELMTGGLGLQTYAGNDATLAGIAELEAGALKDVRCGVLLTLGTGVGSAVVCEGRIQYGANGIASEIGHMIVGKNSYDCSCGRNGCLETFASATALNRYAKKLLRSGTASMLRSMCPQGRIEAVNGIMIFEAAQKGDALANKAVDRVVHYLAIGLTNVIAVLDPERIVLGGGMSRAGSFFLDKVRAEVERIRFYKEIPIGDITYARFGSEAGVIGAAMLARQRIREG